MKLVLLFSFLLSAVLAHASQLTVALEPRWAGQPLVPDQLELTNEAGNTLSITRLAMLLSHAELQRENGQWIGAKNWVEFLDLGKGRLSFLLNGIPAERFKALQFDIGLDEAIDKASTAQWPPQHPLNPNLNALHWSWRGQYVFLALEGRYQQKDQQLGGFSYHLAGQPCRMKVIAPIELDLRSDLRLVLSMHVDRMFSAEHQIDLPAADSTHSGDDGGLAERIADNVAKSFGVLRLEPDLTMKAEVKPELPWKPALLDKLIPPHFLQTQFPSDNPLTAAGIALGKTLFQDPRLSINNTQSCASCHHANAAFSDSKVFSLGAEGQPGVRHVMPLFNLAWKPSFFWDGRSPTLRDQVLKPIQDPLEMHETLDRVVTKLNDLLPRFNEVFGSPEITSGRIALALEQFLLTLISSDSKMDRTLTAGEKLTDQEQRGFLLFFTESDPGHNIKGADCFHCHGGMQFTDHQFHNNGLDADTGFKDDGLGKITGNAADRGKFMTPSLRNLSMTAPYMHDGRFGTLEEVVEHYDKGLKNSSTMDPNLAKHLRYEGLRLTPEDKAALVAFLKTLNGTVRSVEEDLPKPIK